MSRRTVWILLYKGSFSRNIGLYILKGIAAGKKYFNEVLRFSIQAAFQIVFENSQFVKKSQTVKVCSIV